MNLIDSLLVLDPSLRLDAEQALDHLFFFTQPHPAADVKDLMSTISVCFFFIFLCSQKNGCSNQRQFWFWNVSIGLFLNANIVIFVKLSSCRQVYLNIRLEEGLIVDEVVGCITKIVRTFVHQWHHRDSMLIWCFEWIGIWFVFELLLVLLLKFCDWIFLFLILKT